MRGTVNTSQSADVRLCAAATETSVSETARDRSSASGLHQTSMFNGEYSRGALPWDDDDSEAEVCYSGDSDDESDLKSLDKTFESAKAALASVDGSSMATRKVKQSNDSLVDVFSNSDWWSDAEDISKTSDCSPSRKRAEHCDSGASDRTGKDNDEFDRRHCQYDRNESRERSAVTIAGKIQGEPTLLPETKPWMPPQHKIARWTGLSTEHFQLRLFDSVKIHHLRSGWDSDTAACFFIDVFFKHRWFSGHHNQNGDALVQAWTAFITNVELMGLSKWLAKLEANRLKFETRTPVGGRYRLHRLSKAANLPCLSWGNVCPCCAPNAQHAPREAYLCKDRYWSSRISDEMRQAISSLQRLYERDGRQYCVANLPGQGDSCRNKRQGLLEHNPKATMHMLKTDIQLSDRSASFDVPCPRSGTTLDQQDTAKHSASLPAGSSAEKKQGIACLLDVENCDRKVRHLSHRLDNERRARHSLESALQKMRLTQSDERARKMQFELDQERATSSLTNQVAKLQSQIVDLCRSHETLLGNIGHCSYLSHRKRQRTNKTEEGLDL